jgi:pyrroline-5-carboxylate reductase
MKNKRVAILGSGNIGMSLARGFVKSQYCGPEQIMLTQLNTQLMKSQREEGFQVSNKNSDAIVGASIVILSVLPQQLNHLLEEISATIDPKKHLIVSVVSGASCKDIRAKLDEKVRVIRAMPNTAIAIRQSMTCIASDNAENDEIEEVIKMFETVGSVIQIQEELMSSATALCACGIAFFLRAIRAASQGGVEIGFHAEDALKMAVQTAKGAADLLLQNQSHPEREIDKVTSPKGCTIAGLNEMEHQGFSSSLIKGIKLSALKAGSLYTKE